MGMAVLNLNNMRDASRDAATGKKTLALRLGERGARVYHAALFVVGWALLVLFLLVVSPVPWRGWYWMVLMALVHAAHLRFVFMKGPPEGLDDELKKVALSTALVALAMLFSVIRG
jgi:1,4-dihydroxy-2-naphthoate octaprenyltransferase